MQVCESLPHFCSVAWYEGLPPVRAGSVRLYFCRICRTAAFPPFEPEDSFRSPCFHNPCELVERVSGGLESRAIDFGSDLAHICIWSLVIGPWRLVPGPWSLVPQSVDLQSVRSTGPDSKSVIRECRFPECRPPFCFIVFQGQ